ncbi:hypothetical protein PIB30_081436 [Stylosanthes scabra]|uniref:Uncharacterized protein n=1 Tax=Stylosanthes scabra TaxID=79078 RepID=A0ABU6XPS6_9FABA|nr:hypothetical protein [Stylosanthes scabra]
MKRSQRGENRVPCDRTATLCVRTSPWEHHGSVFVELVRPHSSPRAFIRILGGEAKADFCVDRAIARPQISFSYISLLTQSRSQVLPNLQLGLPSPFVPLSTLCHLPPFEAVSTAVVVDLSYPFLLQIDIDPSIVSAVANFILGHAAVPPSPFSCASPEFRYTL